jgi:tetratricopeptide (TPR) repeat protein
MDRALAVELDDDSVPEPGSARSEGAFLEGLEAQAAFGQTREAIEALVLHLEKSPTVRGWRLLSVFRRKEGQPDEADAAAARAETLAREELALVLCERARAAVEGNRTVEARTRFEEARDLAPRLADAWLGIGSLELAREQHAPAELAFREALERDDSLSQAWSGLGLALLEGGRPQEALEALERGLDCDPGSLPAILGIVRAAFQTGRLDRAEERVRACLELRPGNVDLAFTLAGLRVELGDRSGAREMVERVELFRPDYPGLAELRSKLELP